MKKLIGNRNVGESLARLVAAERVPNAFIFAGPGGVGKKQFALELARSLVCLACKLGYACSDCSACKRVGEFTIPTTDKGDDYKRVFLSQHPDVGLVIPFKRNLQVDAIRALEVEAHFRPYEAKARVFILDDADKMNDAASNALLKTLEEPAATSHIILITSRVDKLLPTIRSRSQMIHFGPAEFDEIERYLTGSGHFSPEDAALAARASGGSVGRALEFVPASFRTQRSLMLEVLNAAAAGNHRVLLSASEEMADPKFKEDYEDKLAVLQDMIHDVWLLRNGVDRNEILNLEIAAELEQLASVVGSAELASWINEIEAIRANLIVNLNRKVATDALLVKMAA